MTVVKTTAWAPSKYVRLLFTELGLQSAAKNVRQLILQFLENDLMFVNELSCGHPLKKQ